MQARRLAPKAHASTGGGCLCRAFAALNHVGVDRAVGVTYIPLVLP
jgi:hypothetical protein